MTEATEVAAAALAKAFETETLIDPLSDVLLKDPATAYAIQFHAIDRIEGAIAGWKVGATNPKAQASMRTDGPFYGPILVDCDATGRSYGSVTPGTIGAEIEIAFRIGHDLRRRSTPYEVDEVRDVIQSMHPAIEVIGLRQKISGPLTALCAIADFGGNVLFKAGPAIANWQNIDLTTIGARCDVNGHTMNEGVSSVVLGNPLNALCWLANNGPGLQAGQWISTGSITAVTPVKAGDTVVGDFGSIGSVSLLLEG
ncbi:MAG: fumarylacetoacetate hydrolase family protein [Geminicoccaceae bacterium]|nr:fumarylacetoacetate hydrolase family protein [Geminicoccaceae bacterium]